MKRRSRWMLIWLDMPSIVRVGVILAVSIVIVTCAGCTHLTDPSFDAQVMKQDEADCLANPRRLPDCFFGVELFVQWSWQ